MSEVRPFTDVVAEGVVTEAYWRAKIAGEITQKFLPLCTCGKCDVIEETKLVKEVLDVIKGGSR